MSAEVYENFASAIRSRELANNAQESTLVGIDSAELLEVEMQGDDAMVTVKFVSDQINATIDDNGEVVDGDRNAVVTVTDIWTFARDTRTSASTATSHLTGKSANGRCNEPGGSSGRRDDETPRRRTSASSCPTSPPSPRCLSSRRSRRSASDGTY